MTRDETIALFQRCEEARAQALNAGKGVDEAHEQAKGVWNSWAEVQLAARRELETQGKWHLLERRIEGREYWIARHNREMQSWLLKSRADFSGQRISVGSTSNNEPFELNSVGDWIDLRGYIFPGIADFTESHFCSIALFNRSEFCGPAWFRDTHFNSIAEFSLAKFHEQTKFIESTFAQSGNFAYSCFCKEVDFLAINAKSVFMLEGVYFGSLPNFGQAHFTEAPVLDHVAFAKGVEPGGFWRSVFRRCPSGTPAKYRDLKRLAVQGHNHDLEYKFFKSEQRARRSAFDSPWPWKPNCARFWWSLFYDALSDFGVSTVRPLLLWALSIPVFAYLYHTLPIQDCARNAGSFGLSLYLATNNAFVGLGSSRSSELLKTSACLFGENGEAPNIVAGYIGLLQSTWSALLIFLFALGVRNTFKIK